MRINQSKFFIIILLSFFSYSIFGKENKNMNLIGKHAITLQWLDNFNKGNTGCASIVEKNGKLEIEGSEEEMYKEEKNYLKLKGFLLIKSNVEIEMNGEIITRVDFINSGKENIRKGKFTFKVFGKRPYYRLQNERTQMDGSSEVTDYIDIHFKKCK